MALPIREFSEGVRAQLAPLGLQKRAGDIYTLPVSDDFLGFVGLGRATKHGALRIWPTIGVRHQPSERVLARLLASRFHPYAPPTIATGIGYLMPQRQWSEWLVEDIGKVDVRAAEIAEAIRAYGVPAIRRHSSLAAVLDALATRQVMTSPRAAYLLPIVLAEVGRHGEALATLDEQLAVGRGREDPEADQFRRFAAALRRKGVKG